MQVAGVMQNLYHDAESTQSMSDLSSQPVSDQVEDLHGEQTSPSVLSKREDGFSLVGSPSTAKLLILLKDPQAADSLNQSTERDSKSPEYTLETRQCFTAPSPDCKTDSEALQTSVSGAERVHTDTSQDVQTSDLINERVESKNSLEICMQPQDQKDQLSPAEKVDGKPCSTFQLTSKISIHSEGEDSGYEILTSDVQSSSSNDSNADFSTDQVSKKDESSLDQTEASSGPVKGSASQAYCQSEDKQLAEHRTISNKSLKESTRILLGFSVNEEGHVTTSLKPQIQPSSMRELGKDAIESPSRLQSPAWTSAHASQLEQGTLSSVPTNFPKLCKDGEQNKPQYTVSDPDIASDTIEKHLTSIGDALSRPGTEQTTNAATMLGNESVGRQLRMTESMSHYYDCEDPAACISGLERYADSESTITTERPASSKAGSSEGDSFTSIENTSLEGVEDTESVELVLQSPIDTLTTDRPEKEMPSSEVIDDDSRHEQNETRLQEATVPMQKLEPVTAEPQKEDKQQEDQIEVEVKELDDLLFEPQINHQSSDISADNTAEIYEHDLYLQNKDSATAFESHNVDTNGTNANKLIEPWSAPSVDDSLLEEVSAPAVLRDDMPPVVPGKRISFLRYHLVPYILKLSTQVSCLCECPLQCWRPNFKFEYSVQATYQFNEIRCRDSAWRGAHRHIIGLA